MRCFYRRFVDFPHGFEWSDNYFAQRRTDEGALAATKDMKIEIIPNEKENTLISMQAESFSGFGLFDKGIR